MKRRRVILLLLLGIGIGFGVGKLHATQHVRELLGFLFSHHSFEEYYISIGVDGLGKPRKPTKYEERRETLNFPSFYGTLINITSIDQRTIFWFVDQGGVIRNAYIEESDRRLYRMQAMKTSRYKLEVSR